MVAQLYCADAPRLATPELAHHDHDDLAPLGKATAHAVVTPTSEEKVLSTANVKGSAQTDKQCRVFEQPANYRSVCLGIMWGCVGCVARELRDLTAEAAFLDQAGAAHA